MAVILVDIKSVSTADRSWLTRPTKSAPDISSPSLPKEPPDTSSIFVETLEIAYDIDCVNILDVNGGLNL